MSMNDAFKNIMNNPMTMMGLGFLSGNVGRSDRRAFANSMSGGLQGMQMAQMAGIRAKAEERAEAEYQQKLQEEHQNRLRAALYLQDNPEVAKHFPGGATNMDQIVERQKMMQGTAAMQNARALADPNTPEPVREQLRRLTEKSPLVEVNTAPPSDRLASEAAQAAGVMDMIGNVTKYLDKTGGDQLTGFTGAINELRSQPNLWGLGTNAIMNTLGMEHDPEAAWAIGQLGQVRLQAIQILRGAQVGPKEEEMVARYLPQPGQNIHTMRANLAILGDMTEAIQKRTKLIKQYNYDENQLSQYGLSKDQIQNKYDWLPEDEELTDEELLEMY